MRGLSHERHRVSNEWRWKAIVIAGVRDINTKCASWSCMNFDQLSMALNSESCRHRMHVPFMTVLPR
jgi:hypothetical protein